MPNLHTDVIGQVARLPLKPSETSALLPLYEAVSNSLYAISERFGDDRLAEKGRIDIDIHRDTLEDGSTPVAGFMIRDNGIGLNEENFASFCTPFTQHKISKGGKGIGRLGWLKVFGNITVSSSFLNGDTLKQVEFNFVLRESNQVDTKEPSDIAPKEPGTTVTLSEFLDSYGARCPVKTDTIVQRVIAHFLPVFAGDNSPLIYLHDNGVIDLQKEFKEKINESVEQIIEVEIENKNQPIIVRHMKCDKSIRPRGSVNNWMCFCANDRGVKEYGIDDQIGLGSLDGEQIYVGTVTGDYLDTHVNPQRTDFIFDPEEGRLIRRQVASSVKEFLKEYVEQALAQKKSIAFEIIRKHPQYIYVQDEIDQFVDNLQANSNNEERIYVEMAQNRYRRQRRFDGVKRDIDAAQKYDEAIAGKIDEYKGYILDDKKGSLSEYVIKRKAVLDLLDNFRGFAEADDEKHHLEEAIHQLICPMRIESSEIHIDDNNLWILDDRLAFFNFFASDRPIKSYTESDSGREPDIAFFYDSCVAWRESERSCDTVILVEFKRPGLEDYTDKNDPLMQLMDYVTLFKSSKTIRDRKGNVISGIGANTSFHCYIVADITAGLTKRLRGRFNSTPDGKGLFGYTLNPDTYAEVIPYDKLLLDAQARNSIFFDKLGLSE
ncbi:ATP-binding protein [Algihabitans albus]|uniref:ATP-binding protein n=1 Tax=Algihabitans albus TaxID=2164067 RepID=UPI000E5D0A67|nr:ATP-binding protein [Algihabitans albus]